MRHALGGQGAIERNCKPFRCSHLAGQGATEYLVLLAVVLIIALVSIALLGFFPGMAQDSQMAESQIYWKSARPLSVSETGGAYAYTPSPTFAMTTIRIKNTGTYGIRMSKILGGGSTINETQSGPLTNIYLGPGEEVCLSHWAVPNTPCPLSIYFTLGSGADSTHILMGASQVCNSDGTGNLVIRNFGFEYVAYIEGQAITKRQYGAKDLVIRCVGKT